MFLRNETMRAAIQEKYGAPDVLAVDEVEVPVVGDDEVLVQIRASAVTQGDRRLRAADFPGFLRFVGRLATGLFGPRHRVPGSNFAGRVVAIGDEVTRFSAGDDVFGGCMHGAHADYITVPEESGIARMPPDADYEEVADLSYGAGTALTFLREYGEIEAGDQVAIIGAAGGVGRFAVQLADHFGAEVTAVCRGDDAEFVRDLGADSVVDYTTADLTGTGRAYDIIFDTSGTATFRESRSSLTRDGRFLSLIVGLPLLFHMAWTWLTGGKRAMVGVAMESRDLLEQVRDLVDAGAIRPVIDSCYPLERIRDAHARLESGRPRGSVVVAIGGPEV